MLIYYYDYHHHHHHHHHYYFRQHIGRWMYLADVSAVHDDVGSVVFTQLNLHDRSNLRHHHRHRDVEAVAMVGERQSVVAGTSRYDALPLLLLQAYAQYDETNPDQQTENSIRLCYCM